MNMEGQMKNGRAQTGVPRKDFFFSPPVYLNGGGQRRRSAAEDESESERASEELNPNGGEGEGRREGEDSAPGRKKK